MQQLGVSGTFITSYNGLHAPGLLSKNSSTVTSDAACDADTLGGFLHVVLCLAATCNAWRCFCNEFFCILFAGRWPLAQGCAQYLLGTATTTLAVCGVWGMGKSSFMKLVEKMMMMQLFEERQSPEESPEEFAKPMDPALKATLRRRASPRLICAWFNAW